MDVAGNLVKIIKRTFYLPESIIHHGREKKSGVWWHEEEQMKEITTHAIGSISLNPGCSIQLDQAYAQALEGLGEFSHILVVWYAAGTSEVSLTVKTPYRRGPEQLGLFATRSPIRPSGICICTSEIIKVDVPAGRVYLTWIDADEHTPVLDIKPYHPSSDRVMDVRLPQWCSHWPGSFEESGNFDWEAEFLH